MKLWDKGTATDKKIDQFTVGNDRAFDLILAKYDIKGSLAHAKMLLKCDYLNAEEYKALEKELNKILGKIEAGNFKIDHQFEDVHSKVEFLLTQKLGETGKKIHTARSRNDQVLVDMHLYLKDEIIDLKQGINTLFELLLKKAETHKDILMPGYTHFQIAMPSSFGLWFSAYAESLIDDLYLLKAAYLIVDQNPLGSAAGYGSSFAIDREFTTQELGFKTLKYNVIAAQMSRGKSEKAMAMAMSAIGGTLSKFAMDICLYMSQNFNFISFPDALTTGSSIMPHKKNPDVFELIRAKCNSLQALPTELNLLTTNLPSGYHRDLQLLKEKLLPAIQTLKSCLEMLCFSIKEIQLNKNILDDKKYDSIFTVEALNKLVQQGLSFREAYKKIGAALEQNEFVAEKALNHTHIGSIGNLCLDEIRSKMKQANKF